jgi:membrane protease YdiL (CAAX protease family)
MPPPPEEPAPALPTSPANAMAMPPVPPPVPAPPSGTRGFGGGPQGLPAVDWSFGRALLVGVVTNLLLAQVLVAALAFIALGVTNADDPATVYVGIIGDIAWLGFMLVWLARWHPGWRERIGIVAGRRGLRDAAVGFGGGLLLYPIIAIAIAVPLTYLFQTLSGSSATTPDQLPAHLNTPQTIASAVLAIVVAPVVEELYFRGIVFRSLRDRHGFWVGALVSGVIFGLVHYVPAPWQDSMLLQAIMVFTGIALAWIYERRGNLVADIAAHMAFNTIGIVLIIWAR